MNWLKIFLKFFMLSLLVGMLSFQPVLASTNNDRGAAINDTPFYDPLSCSYEEDDPNQCACSATGVGSEISTNIPEPWRGLFLQSASQYQANPNFLATLFLTENANEWRPFDYDWATSPAGASGPMQFMPGTWASYGVDGNGDGVVDINSPHDSVFAAGNLVTTGLGTNQTTVVGTLDRPLAPNTLLRAAASYNWGPGNVEEAGDDATLEDLPQETENYLRNVSSLFESNFTKSGHPAYGDPQASGGGSGGGICLGGGMGIADGFTFPMLTTQSAIQQGVEGTKWCYQNTSNCHHHYNAADIMMPTGTQNIAAIAGQVVHAVNQTSAGGVGSRVTIKGIDGNLYYYAHMGASTLEVEEGMNVSAGQLLGLVGTRDDAVGTPPHLHMDALPPQYDYRPNCSSGSCMGYPFIDIQPALVKSYAALPQS